jgi:hypothetical protein
MRTGRSVSCEMFVGILLFVGAGVLRTSASLAQWDSTFADPGPDAPVLALHVEGSDLYVGGKFNRIGATASRGIIHWDGTEWSSLGGGVSGMVRALAVGPDGRLYAGGNFDSAGATPAHNVAMWDGESWRPLGTGTDDEVMALAFDREDQLYAGGQFIRAGDRAVNGIARWDGEAWHGLGSGIQGGVRSMDVGPRNGTSPGWPGGFDPQRWRAGSSVRPHVWDPPAASSRKRSGRAARAGVGRHGNVPSACRHSRDPPETPSCPKRLSPQHQASPPSVSPHACPAPVTSSVKRSVPATGSG